MATVYEAVKNAVGEEEAAKAWSPSTQMAVALMNSGKSTYEGTVPWHVKARRRAKNKVARKSRRNNR